MKSFRLKKLSVLVISALPLMTQAQVINENNDNSELTLISTESTNIETEIHQQKDNSRIYLEEGAIWAMRDVTKFDPVLDIDLSDEIEVENKALKDVVSFNIETNYPHYINKWELSIYRGSDRHLSQPIKTLSGTKLNNDDDIDWDGKTDIPVELNSGEQIIFRLKVWDKNNNMDITSMGVSDLVATTDKNVEIDKLDNENNGSKRSYGRASLMRHNIPTNAGMAKIMGSGLKGVDQVTIGDDEYDVEDGKLYVEQYLPTDAYMFPVKVNFENGKERNYKLFARIPDTYYAQAGLIDLYFGRNHVSGNDEVLSVDDQYQGDVFDRGRIAYFGQGKFGDKLRVVAHVDTKESKIKDMFKHPFAADDTTVFDVLDDNDNEMYYGTYGDESNIEKVVNTKGKVYLDLQYDKSSIMWGNYNTGITGSESSDYNRSLYGLKANYKTRETTVYGDDRIAISGFTSEADTLSSHDEFLGTNSVVYRTRHGEVVPGSDKVTLKVKDNKTGNVISTKTLVSGRDYTINPFQGRIILSKALSQHPQGDSDGVFGNVSTDDQVNILVVDYEYVPDSGENLDNMSTGARIKTWVNDSIGLGSTYVSEKKSEQDYELYSADITLRATEGSYLTAEFSKSEGTQSDSNYYSTNGGISFDKIEGNHDKDRKGNLIDVHGVASLYDLMPETFGAIGNDVEAWYRDKDLGYSFADQDDYVSQKAYGAKLRFQVGDKAQITTSYEHLEELDEFDTKTTDTDQVEIESQYRINESVKLSLAARHLKELNEDDKASKGDLVGARIDYEFDDSNSVYIKGQKTVSTDDYFDSDDSIAVGADFELTDDWSVSGEYATGQRGDGIEASVDYQVTDNYSTYVSYVQQDYEHTNNVVFGQNADLTESLSITQENQFVDDNNGKGQVNSFGFDYDVTDDFDTGITFEKSNLDSVDNGKVERSGVSVYTNIDYDNISLSNRIEYRIDKGDDKVEEFATTNRYVHELTDEYTLFAKLNYSKSKNKSSGEVLERYSESSLGLAYRPVFNDRLNFLTRYTYLEDFDQNNGSDDDNKNEKSHIVEGEALYDVNQHIELGTKVAYKKKSEVYSRIDDSNIDVKNEIFLTGVSASYKVMKDWDVTSEYHWKKDKENDELEHGALISVNKHINDNMKVGIGYNFSKFEDDLVHDDEYNAKGVFINIVGKF
ncbi:hypothetical protein C0W80_06625 [Photobacterium leiognathi subsp. mandapamensis]|uniref:hypothetical protein n=1 Tax=Photobacterium leiognathi TaxID=553611 RepID=UPI000D17D5D0|nr:hypothetical protein [Photobacterium leiognathi]PSV02658.1 hypothetical protein C0W80_06625 [Photobacterium leiognathi subsp. mandapamensis]